MPCRRSSSYTSSSRPRNPYVLAAHSSPHDDHTIGLPISLSKSSDPLTNSVPASQAMHQGVVRDMEQQRIKRERQLDFDLQRQLEAEYKQEQTVRSSIEAAQQQDGVKR